MDVRERIRYFDRVSHGKSSPSPQLSKYFNETLDKVAPYAAAKSQKVQGHVFPGRVITKSLLGAGGGAN